MGEEAGASWFVCGGFFSGEAGELEEGGGFGGVAGGGIEGEAGKGVGGVLEVVGVAEEDEVFVEAGDVLGGVVADGVVLLVVVGEVFEVG